MTFDDFLQIQDKLLVEKQAEIDKLNDQISNLHSSKMDVDDKFSKLFSDAFENYKIEREKEVKEFEANLELEKNKANLIAEGNTARIALTNTYTQAGLMKLKEAELITIATSLGLEVSTKNTKVEIISKILNV